MPVDTTDDSFMNNDIKLSPDNILSNTPFLQKIQLKLKAVWQHGMDIP